MDVSLIDEIVCVREEDAYAAGRDMVACEGVLVGITAGAALWAATQLALRPENAGKTIVALLPDTGEPLSVDAAVCRLSAGKRSFFFHMQRETPQGVSRCASGTIL